MCIRDRRKEHNQIDEFIAMPNIKKLEQSKVQKEVKIVKAKQQKKIPEQKKEESFEERWDKIFKMFGKVMEECDRKMSDEERQQLGQWIERFKKMNEPLETTPEGRKETEIREDQNTVLSENKDRKDKEKIQTMEESNQKIRKTCRRNIVSTKEEMEMRKGGLISAFNIPINERRELCKGMKYTRNFMKITKLTHHRTIIKTLDKFKYYVKVSMVKEYMTKSIISLIRKIPVKHLVNSTDIQGNGKIGYTSNYIRIEEIRFLINQRELNITEYPELNEDLTTACLLYTSRCV